MKREDPNAALPEERRDKREEKFDELRTDKVQEVARAQLDEPQAHGRRDFLKQSALATTALMLAPRLADSEFFGAFRQSNPGTAIEEVSVRLRINGSNYGMRLDPRVTVLDTLRERLDLTGTKKGCNHGQCGACTVIINGERINSCLALAVIHDEAEITTVEGLANGDQLHPMQAAFIKHDGLQCGYCTPGQICSAVAMLREAQAGTASAVTADVRQTGRIELSDEEIKERMSGNLCRCGAYNGIVAAIKEASGTRNNAAPGARNGGE